ncbi:MAG: metallophosphoesterase family protein [Gemmatimonadaceae bacterium]|nr:metallophosphoesterase family protein [Gemmatimonadaceae bacterium]
MNIEEPSASEPHIIGLISDTHGMVRADVHEALKSVGLILHAGDVGDGVLAELGTIAPVRAVFGNTDPAGDPSLAQSLELQIGGVSIHVSHGHELGSPKADKLAIAYDADVIVYGHTHRQQIVHVGDKLVVNPGAAGARRFNLHPSVAILTISSGTASAQIIELDD